MRSKTLLFTTSLLSTSAALAMTASVHAADDVAQTPDTPAAETRLAPKPSLQEEIVYLRDVMAVQTLRMDEAEQMLERQSKLIELQEQRIAQLEAQLAATQTAAANANQALAQLRNGAGASTAPSAFSADDASDVYLVRAGDTLGEIAAEKNTTVAALARVNNLKAPYRLSIGQRLAVPASAAPAAPALATAPDQQKIAQTDAPSEPLPTPASQDVSTPRTETVPDSDDDAPRDNRDGGERVAAVTERRPDESADPDGLPEEVGQRPEEDDEATPYVALLSDVGGILTPKGALFVEPSVTFTTSSDNRFFFNGAEILDALLIGAIEATDSDRLALTESLGFRYGITDRLEIDAKVSHVYREDRVSGVSIDGSATNPSQTFIDDVYGAGFGDAEFGLHYQINDGRKFPYVIANVRAKAPTGNGPFDVERTPGGIETELATGSGYWSIEPSVTFILPADPAVIFANIGYQANLPTTPDQQIGRNSIIREFDAGDAIRSSFGIGLSLNERLSMNLGYSQSYILATKSTFEDLTPDTLTGSLNPRVLRQPAVTVGAFSAGGSYAVTDRVSINLNTSLGATDEAPDMTVSLRANIRLFD